MLDRLQQSSIELLEPRTPADRRALYELVRDALLPTGTGSDAVSVPAVAAVRHLCGYGGRVHSQVVSKQEEAVDHLLTAL